MKYGMAQQHLANERNVSPTPLSAIFTGMSGIGIADSNKPFRLKFRAWSPIRQDILVTENNCFLLQDNQNHENDSF